MKRRTTPALAPLVALALLGAAAPAAAVPDECSDCTPAYARPLTRLGDQLVRGDDLTGLGARAPSAVPEWTPLTGWYVLP
jgi:hypothetical protein